MRPISTPRLRPKHLRHPGPPAATSAASARLLPKRQPGCLLVATSATAATAPARLLPKRRHPGYLCATTPMAGAALGCGYLLAAALAAAPAAAQWPIRPPVEEPVLFRVADGDPNVWDLNELYPSPEAWEEALTEVRASLERLRGCEGQVAANRKSLVQCMTDFTATLKQLLRAHAYASLGSDADLNDSDWQRRAQQTDLLYNEIQKVAAFFEPELVARGKRLQALARGRELADYDFYFADLLRRGQHTLSAAEERLLAAAAGPAQEFYEAYSVLMNAEMPWPQVATPEGEEMRLDSQGYGVARQSLDRGYRALVFESFFGTLGRFSKTIANLLSGQVRNQVVEAQVRGFESALAARLHTDNLPQEVYRGLIGATNETLPTLHRYFGFRQRLLGLRQMRYYDIYPPLVPALHKSFPLDEGKQLMLQALAPLGTDYGRRLQQGLLLRWMHVHPAEGKRSGAYMNGSAYDVHPYILLNYSGGFADVSTLVHEWGHALHSLYANETQPFTKADYSTFIAELAAILPQVLLLDRMIEQASTPEERLYYLAEAMEDIRGTFYRQVMFAEFEQRIHEMAAAGEVLDSESLSDTYAALVRRYHGAERGVVEIPSYVRYEWAYIPHFYYNFYVFQYATSMAAAFYLADRIRTEGEPAAERFIALLRAGGSDYPYELLLKAGIDMANVDVYKAVARRMQRLLDLGEQTLAVMDGRVLPETEGLTGEE